MKIILNAKYNKDMINIIEYEVNRFTPSFTFTTGWKVLINGQKEPLRVVKVHITIYSGRKAVPYRMYDKS